MYILGINAYHADASAALIGDGEVLAAVEEERLSRIKHHSGVPYESIRWLLESTGVKASEIEHVAFSRSPHTHIARRVASNVKRSLVSRRLPHGSVGRLHRIESLPGDLSEQVGMDRSKTRFHFVEHHPAHMASAFYASELEEALVCSIDGLGDHVSVAWGVGRGSDLTLNGRVYFPHSLGFFYTAITQFLGFPHYGDEYKVMGLAPYGEPALMAEMSRIISIDGSKPRFRLNSRYFRHFSSEVIWRTEDGSPEIGTMYTDRIAELLGPPRGPGEPITNHHCNVAASAQQALEDAVSKIIGRIIRQSGIKDLALAGGVALNVTTNTRLKDEGKIGRMYVQPAATDSGTSIGAAFYVLHDRLGVQNRKPMSHVYLGPEYSVDAMRAALVDADLKFVELDDDALCARTAQLLAKGKIVGWFQGAVEFGPRALGNRSIVCDPRDGGMKDVLNARTKRREGFRPFAPSVLVERSREIFEMVEPSPYMLFAPRVKNEWRDRIPAVTHVDGTSRIQTVDRRQNELYWKLIKAFDDLTGVPVVLNTSFNENEPIVCNPNDAVACFVRADMDVLVMGPFIVG